MRHENKFRKNAAAISKKISETYRDYVSNEYLEGIKRNVGDL